MSSIRGCRQKGGIKAFQGDSGSGCDQCIISGGIFLIVGSHDDQYDRCMVRRKEDGGIISCTKTAASAFIGYMPVGGNRGTDECSGYGAVHHPADELPALLRGQNISKGTGMQIDGQLMRWSCRPVRAVVPC